MTGLERHCRWLLRAYPAPYRAERGDEMLTTLVETVAPGRAWPGWREAAALVLGGLQVRGQQHRRLPTAANLRLSVVLGLAVSAALLGSATAGWPVAPFDIGSPSLLPNASWLFWLTGGWAALPWGNFWAVVATFALTACAPAAAWIGRRAVAVSVLLAAAVAVPFAEASASGLAGSNWLQWVLGLGLPVSLLLVGLAVVTALGTDRPPRAWLWWYALPPIWILGDRLTGIVPFAVTRAWVGLPLYQVFVLGAIVWIVVDSRPAIALAVVLSVLGVTSAAGGIYPTFGQQTHLHAEVTYFGAGLVLAAPALLRMRRQAVL
jgi:hypothetical protein